MAYTHGTTTWYTQAELASEAKAVASSVRCPACDKRLRVAGWELCISKTEEPCLQVHAACTRHGNYSHTINHAI